MKVFEITIKRTYTGIISAEDDEEAKEIARGEDHPNSQLFKYNDDAWFEDVKEWKRKTGGK